MFSNIQSRRSSSQATQLFYYTLQNVPPVSRKVLPKQVIPVEGYKEEALTFYEEMKPLLFILRILGILPYNNTVTGEICFKFWSIPTLYSLALITTVLVMAGFTEVEMFNRETQTVSFAAKTVSYALELFHISSLLIPLCQWPETCRKIKFINSWTELQVEYREITGKQLHFGLRRKGIIFLVVSIPITTFLIVETFLYGMILHWWQVLLYAVQLAVTTFLPVIWLFTCSGISTIARELANEIENQFSNGLDNKRKITDYKKLWLRLSKLTQDLGSSTGLTYGSQTLVFFTTSVLLSYGFLTELEKNFEYVTLSAAMLFQIIIFAQCNAAQSVSMEVSCKFLDRLQGVLDKISLNYSEEIYEMRIFLAAIARNPTTISFCGFVDVNRGLMTSFISAMVTYLVVLMQFQMSDDTSAKGSSNTTH